jgi:hypothetical protein
VATALPEAETSANPVSLPEPAQLLSALLSVGAPIEGAEGEQYALPTLAAADILNGYGETSLSAALRQGSIPTLRMGQGDAALYLEGTYADGTPFAALRLNGGEQNYCLVLERPEGSWIFSGWFACGESFAQPDPNPLKGSDAAYPNGDMYIATLTGGDGAPREMLCVPGQLPGGPEQLSFDLAWYDLGSRCLGLRHSTLRCDMRESAALRYVTGCKAEFQPAGAPLLLTYSCAFGSAFSPNDFTSAEIRQTVTLQYAWQGGRLALAEDTLSALAAQPYLRALDFIALFGQEGSDFAQLTKTGDAQQKAWCKAVLEQAQAETVESITLQYLFGSRTQRCTVPLYIEPEPKTTDGFWWGANPPEILARKGSSFSIGTPAQGAVFTLIRYDFKDDAQMVPLQNGAFAAHTSAGTMDYVLGMQYEGALYNYVFRIICS